MDKISIITFCKGRLHHLKESLPKMLEQKHDEMIVVDYACPDGTGEWVKSKYGNRVKVVKAEEDKVGPHLNRAHARNMGAAASSGDYLVFFDSDSLANDPHLTEQMVNCIKCGAAFVNVGPLHKKGCGNCCISREIFETVRGYPENMVGWGFEDRALMLEATKLGDWVKFSHKPLPITMIQHKDDDRLRFDPIGHKPKSVHKNRRLYARMARNNPYGWGREIPGTKIR